MRDRKPADDDRVVLSAIIPTYNASAVLADCLVSIARNPPSEPYEIIVVDDASTDGTSEMVRARFPAVRLLRNEVNQRYALSNNRAFACAKGEYFLLLNNDTIVLPEAFDHMLAFLREHPEIGGVGAKLLNEDGSIQWSVKSLPSAGAALFGARSILTWLYPNNRWSPNYLLHLGRDLTVPFAAAYVSSAAFMVSRHVIAAVGGLDQRFFYHVDADYCKRMADIGYKSYYLPTATVIHLNHEGGSRVGLRQRFWSLLRFHMDSYRYYRKHVQTSTWSPMQVIVVGGLSARFLLSILTQCCAEMMSIVHPPRRRVAGLSEREEG